MVKQLEEKKVYIIYNLIFTFGTDLNFSTPLRNNLRGVKCESSTALYRKKIDVFFLLLKCKTCALIKYTFFFFFKVKLCFRSWWHWIHSWHLTIISICSLFCLSFISSLLLISAFENTEKVMFEFSFSFGFAKWTIIF